MAERFGLLELAGADVADGTTDGAELSRDMVAHTQRDLIRLGFDPGRPDGLIGPKTRRAIRLFQKTMGMKADGVLTAELQATLRAAR